MQGSRKREQCKADQTNGSIRELQRDFLKALISSEGIESKHTESGRP